jgi:acetoin utilization protein AcuB
VFCIRPECDPGSGRPGAGIEPAGTGTIERRRERDVKEDRVTARDVMTANPVTVTPQATVAEAIDLMRELDIRHVPVIEGGALVGMLSDRDLAYLDVGRLLVDEGVDALRRRLSMPVIKVMSSDVIFVEPDTELADVVALMLESKVGALPVVQPDTREVVGIVSYIDVLREVQDLLEEE